MVDVSYLTRRDPVKKKIKLKDIFLTEDKNIFRTNFFFNYGKYRHKKWKFQRSYKLFEAEVIFKRFAPNITYIPKYSYIINADIMDADDMKINKFEQYLTYKSKLFLKKRLLGFFRIQRAKLLKKFLIFRHMSTHFNVFDTNYEIILIRFGLAESVKEARAFIRSGVLKINGHIVNQTRHLNHRDLVEFSQKQLFKEQHHAFYSKDYRQFVNRRFNANFNLYSHLRVLLIEYGKHQKGRFNYPYHLIGFLPFISTFNFSNFSFIYDNKLMKNQWHFFIDFFIAKKFIQYNR